VCGREGILVFAQRFSEHPERSWILWGAYVLRHVQYSTAIRFGQRRHRALSRCGRFGHELNLRLSHRGPVESEVSEHSAAPASGHGGREQDSAGESGRTWSVSVSLLLLPCNESASFSAAGVPTSLPVLSASQSGCPCPLRCIPSSDSAERFRLLLPLPGGQDRRKQRR